jgi:hypothetical protein
MVKSNNNASSSKASRNAASLRLWNIKSPATKVLSKNAKFLLLITVFRTGPEKCTLLQIYLEYNITSHKERILDCVWNVMAHAQKPDFAFQRNGRVHLNRRGRQFSRILAAEVCASACRVCTARASLRSAVTWRLLVTHSILLFPLHFSARASPCAITFQTQSTSTKEMWRPSY